MERLNRETLVLYLPQLVAWSILTITGILVLLALLAGDRGGSLDDLPAPAIKNAVDAATAPGEA